ncbi:MAG: hypothetical protein IJU76_08335 [Desulfovibrionaceae bacterium]|nr:hypothetical protein [Desulfovibrionaceae bacterium]
MADIKGNIRVVGGDRFLPASSADKVIIDDASGNPSNVQLEIGTIRTQISSLAGLDTIQIRGSVDATHQLPTTGYKTGWGYLVEANGTYAGKTCEIGDMLVCKSVSDPGVDSDWTVLQVNLVNAITGLTASTDEDVMCFNGTNGKQAKGTGITKTQLTVASGVGATLDSNKTELAKYNGSNGLPTYNGTVIGNGIPVVENGASAPEGLLPGALYFEKDPVATPQAGE